LLSFSFEIFAAVNAVSPQIGGSLFPVPSPPGDANWQHKSWQKRAGQGQGNGAIAKWKSGQHNWGLSDKKEGKGTAVVGDAANNDNMNLIEFN
jgi:hypothetical protein